jgi:signal transduction histidine kinase
MRLGIELDSARWEMMRMLGRALLPLLLVLPLTVALLYIGVARGLQPLKTLASQIARRSPGVLQPVDTAGVPTEMLGVVSSLNELLRLLALALEGEQRFTANAAHELLTPLAAIKTEVQLCQLQLDDQRGEAMLARIAQRVDRATHTVEQLLTLARLDPDIPLLTEQVDLKNLIEEVLADTAPLAESCKQQVALQADENLVVTGSEQGLTILLRNLLRNAFRYASDGSVIQVTLHGRDPVQLEVRNDCQALSSEEFARICERFYRVPGSVGQGAGLGLSIVARIAEQHGAELAVGPAFTDQGGAGQGFCVRLSFPPAVAVP